MIARALALVLLLASCRHGAVTGAPEGRSAMSTLHEVRHVSVSIARAPADVYAFAADPENLPRWASGVANGIRRVGGEWIADSPMGEVKLRFVPRNDLGVLDHDVVLPTGATVRVPIRVLPNGTGSEVVLTVVREAGASDEKFASAARWVEKDLNTLKALLER